MTYFDSFLDILEQVISLSETQIVHYFNIVCHLITFNFPVSFLIPNLIVLT